MDTFRLGAPALVCRWRLSGRRLPMQNRHLRALAARKVGDAPVTSGLLAWTTQHIEWTLEDGAAQHPDGVLMIAVDVEGKAAMSVGPYRALQHRAANDLLARACQAQREAETTGVAPENLWVVRGDTLVWGSSSEFAAAASSSLVYDLARTLGMPVRRDEELLRVAASKGMQADEVFLVSDEHGVVPATDRTGMRAAKFAQSYQKLLAAEAAKACSRRAGA